MSMSLIVINIVTHVHHLVFLYSFPIIATLCVIAADVTAQA